MGAGGMIGSVWMRLKLKCLDLIEGEYAVFHNDNPHFKLTILLFQQNGSYSISGQEKKDVS